MPRPKSDRIAGGMIESVLNHSKDPALTPIERLAAATFDAEIVILCLPGEGHAWLKGRRLPPAISRLAADCMLGLGMHGFIVTITDGLEDARLRRLAKVIGQPALRGLAAAPLINQNGDSLGVLCAAWQLAGPISAKQTIILGELAALALIQYELRLAAGGLDAGQRLPNRARFLQDTDRLHLTDRGRPHVCILINLAESRYIADVNRALGAVQLEAMIRDAIGTVAAMLPQGQIVYQVDVAQFAILSEHAARAEWQPLAERLVDHLHSPGSTARFPFLSAAAIGVAPFQPRERPTSDLLRIALIAAETARTAGTGWALHDPAVDKAHQRAFRLLTDLHPVLRSGAADPAQQLALHYQPRICLRTGMCVGAEALLRWSHPELGSIGPAEFIPLAERSSLPRAMTEWVMETALSQLAAWQAVGLRLHLAVNISATNLEETDFADRARDRLNRYGVAADHITFEFTETAMFSETACGSEQLARLAALGITLAIDDFGTGYGNLTYLQRVPAKVLKLDRSFIGPLPGSPRDRTIVRNTIAMAHELGYRVVAEGVEEPEVRALLEEWGCDEAQGYLFSHPLPSPGFLEYLERQAA